LEKRASWLAPTPQNDTVSGIANNIVTQQQTTKNSPDPKEKNKKDPDTVSFFGAEFLRNVEQIKKELVNNPWLKRNILIVELGKTIALSQLMRSITDLGYTKVWEVRHRGEFSQRGGSISIFPINTTEPWSIEFNGNVIENIGKSSAWETDGGEKKIKLHTPLAAHQASLFQIGDFVVHIDHGIGILRDITEEDFILEYAAPANRPDSPDRLYVPRKEHARLQPYIGFKKPNIHRLGTPVWSITKKKAKEDIIEYAKTLLATLAERHTHTRPPYEIFSEQEDELVAQFLHEETLDQTQAIKETLGDMEKPTPMERIIAGDVGFGKTEIAIRATLRAVLNGRQVAVLAPTTILADQHAEVFKKRLEPLGVSVVRLTRLESSKNIKKITTGIAHGSIDVVIGSHKILGLKFTAPGGPAMGWKNLGLLIIDEEQKFGVVHKELLKKEYPTLDILTLSATPIPRTLHMGLSKLQSMSLITTPPKNRMEIQTFVLPKNKKIIKDAIVFELTRGGQIYFLANRIHSMPQILKELHALRTGARIGMLHGRMPDVQILKTMHDFREKRIDLLVSTTIVENGLDISDANTLIVENATLLGLAEAHQLRGRIGRGDKEAFAYFLYPVRGREGTQRVSTSNRVNPNHQEKRFTRLVGRAAERLEALERYSWRGAGMDIAKRDLELRGCGNILGKAQSGVAYRVGLNLYFEMLEDAVQQLKK
jgi:transcription-repair coupling factor (superfamily II helicase)